MTFTLQCKVPLAFRVVFFSHQLSSPPVVVQWFAVLVQPRALQLPGGWGGVWFLVPSAKSLTL